MRSNQRGMGNLTFKGLKLSLSSLVPRGGEGQVSGSRRRLWPKRQGNKSGNENKKENVSSSQTPVSYYSRSVRWFKEVKQFVRVGGYLPL